MRPWAAAILGVLLLALVLARPAVAAGVELDELRIALRPSKLPEDAIKKHKPLADYLAKRLGVRVSVRVGADYLSVVRALINKEVHVAYLGPFSYVLAHDDMEGRVEPLVVGVRKSPRRHVYNSIIVASAKSGITDPKQFRGSHTFAFPDPASTSGFLVPFYRFAQLGLNPDTIFRAVHIAGSHAAALLEVQRGMVEGAASNMQTYEALLRKKMIDIDQVRIIWKSPDLPFGPITVRRDLPGEIKYRLLKAFISAPSGLDTYEGEIERYEPAFDQNYDVIRDISERLGDLVK